MPVLSENLKSIGLDSDIAIFYFQKNNTGLSKTKYSFVGRNKFNT